MKRYNLVNNALGWLCFVVAAVTYLLTLEPTASFWDCPEFILQGTKLDIGHPPGNPIFMLTARFFVTIFGMDHAAVAINSMSALLSAATILLLFWTVTHLVKKILVRDDATEVTLPQLIAIMGSGLCGALVYTWSDTFWFSAVEAEVYAFSSFCTALVFWLILKWENCAEQPHSDRYLVLLAYVIGVSIAVHLLNLLCIPAIVLVFYYRKFKNVNAKGSLIALGVSVVIVAAILYGLVPGFIKVAQGFELFFVNVLGMGYNTGALIYAVLLLAVFAAAIYATYNNASKLTIRILFFLAILMSGLTFATDNGFIWALLTVGLLVYLLGFSKNVPTRIFNVLLLSVFVIFIGYSSYALLLIRASANPPMNQNAPDNVFALSSYLNREQYGQRPLFWGPVFAEEIDYKYDKGSETTFVEYTEGQKIATKPIDNILRDGMGAAIDNGTYSYTKAYDGNGYVRKAYTPDYVTAPDFNMLFTRIYSTDPDHVKGYKSWIGYKNPDLDNLSSIVPQQVREQWDERGYVTQYDLNPYLRNLQHFNTFEDGSANGAALGWKASFADNLKYFFNYQLNHMYWRYFMWNFAGRQNDIQGNGEPHLGNWITGIPFIDNALYGDQSLLPDEFGKGNKGHNVFYMLPLLLGLIGLLWQALGHHRNNPDRGIEQFWVIFFLFFMTGVAIVLYLNQTPGQPRERDYAFAGSFYAYAIWVGMGVAAIYALANELANKKGQSNMSTAIAGIAALIGLAVPLQMVSQTWDDHDRSGRYTARDFGENYLYSLDDNAIIFTNGDNDTFPLWYAQEVEGVRPDVRVVNLSYLGTDWYANQMQHPYHEAAGINMLATPADYSYDQMAYSYTLPARAKQIPALAEGEQPDSAYFQAVAETVIANRGLSADNPITAIEGLKRFYAAPPRTDIASTPLHVLTTPYMYAPVDREAAIAAFGIDSTATDETAAINYLGDITLNSLASGGFSLSKLLSFDMLANSVANGFDRPIYFATTVPNRYYLGLEPYMRTTGLAKQVTPFLGEPTSVTAHKAYENIVSKFKWGGLDNGTPYLDETVRRIVSTVRNQIIEIASDLLVEPEKPASDFAKQWAQQNGQDIPQTQADMARALLNLMEQKLPVEAAIYESITDMSTIVTYLKLWAITGNDDDLSRAEQLIDLSLERYAQYVRYANALPVSQVNAMGNSDRFALQNYVPMLTAWKGYIALRKQLQQEPELYAEYVDALDNTLTLDDAFYIAPYVYIDDLTSNQLQAYATQYQRSGAQTAARALLQAALVKSIHEDLGIDPLEFTAATVKPYGLTVADLDRYAK